MAGQFHWKIKYNYVMRYQKGESVTKLSRETRSNLVISRTTIYRWNKRYLEKGLAGLKSRSGKNKRKPKIDYDSLTREELLEIVKIYKDIEKFKKDKCKNCIYQYIKDYKGLLPRYKICLLLNISKSAFYRWKSQGFKVKYDKEILDKISFLFTKYNKVIGFRRITIYLEKEFKIKINPKTTLRYMRRLGIKSMIRKSIHKKPEQKDTHFKCLNIINRDFKGDYEYQKIYTDISYIRYKDNYAYLSITIDGFNNQIIDYRISLSNNTNLVLKNIRNTLKKCPNQKPIIHSDHGKQYSSNKYQQMVKQKKFIQSMSRVGNSLDNRPAEYFFSVFKQECWRWVDYSNLNLNKVNVLIKKFIYFYNYERFQSSLNNLSPIEYKKSVQLNQNKITS